MIARNEGMLPEEVLNIQVENNAGKDVRITPVQLMKYYSAGGIGGKTKVNNDDSDSNDDGDVNDTVLRENS